jgi:hypothetical protein
VTVDGRLPRGARKTRWPLRALAAARSAGWPVDALLAGPVVAYCALRQPVVGGLALAVVVGVPLALTRVDLLVLAIVPVSVFSATFWPGRLLVYAIVVVVAVAVVLAPNHRAGGGWSPLRMGWVPLCVGALLILVLTSVADGSSLPSDLPGLVCGLVLLAAVSVARVSPVRLAQVVTLAGAAAAGHVLVLGAASNDRLEGLGVGTNYLGAVLAMPAATGVGLARRYRSPGWLGAAAVCVFAIVETHSRGSLVAVAVGSAVALIADRPLRQRIVGAATASLAGAVLALVHNPFSDFILGGRSAPELNSNSAVRADAARLAFAMAVDHPGWGIGYGSFPDTAMNDPRLGIYINTHNDYLRLAAEVGVAAVVLFAVLLVAGLTAPAWPVLVPVRAAVAAGATNLVFANVLSNLTVCGAFWICLGCLLATRTRRWDPERHLQREEQHA